jgi:hypothetical protein
MRRQISRMTIRFVFILAMLVPLFVAAPEAGAVPPAVVSLRTDGHTLVWIYSYYTATLYAQTVGQTETRKITENVSSPDVSGDRVVWQTNESDGSHLGGINLSTNEPLDLPSPPGQQYSPSLDGDQLVWINTDTSGATPVRTIMTSDLSSDATPVVVATVPSDVSDIGRPEIFDDWIVWSEQFGAVGTSDGHWELWSAQSGQDPVKIASAAGSANYLSGYAVGGSHVVYSVAGEVHLLSSSEQPDDHVIGAGSSPTTDGRYVFWTSQPVQVSQNIEAYDVATDSKFAAVPDGNFNYGASAGGGVVAWVALVPYTSSPFVQSARINDILPSAARPDPGKTSPDWFYFPETGHYLSFGFKHFWQASGGLPVFGYPLTEEFTQHNLTVQYLERQRFEYHPEFAGTPYETELGRLGAEDAAQRDLIGTQPFQPAVIPSTAVGDTCSYFDETHHAVCGGFLAYWQSHGLDFGDRGISFRESLALFGYPISEEFVDPATGMTVQYFERAVFEYHPNNLDPYKIELRLLGRDALSSMGW